MNAVPVRRLLLAALAIHASAAPEFVGVLRTPATTLVALRAAPDSPAAWVRVGAEFSGYAVLRLDERAEQLTLRDATDVIRLSLPKGRIQDLAASSDVVALAAISPAVRENLRLLATAAAQYFWESGAREAPASVLFGAEKTVFRVESIAGEDYSRLRFALKEGGRVRATDPTGTPVDDPADFPLAIIVPPGTTLAAVAARLSVSLEILAALNPNFDSPRSANVRLR